MKNGPRLYNTDIADTGIWHQRLGAEVREWTALEHQTLSAHRHLDTTLQNQHKIIDWLSLLVDNNAGIRFLFSLAPDVMHYVLIEKAT